MYRCKYGAWAEKLDEQLSQRLMETAESFSEDLRGYTTSGVSSDKAVRAL